MGIGHTDESAQHFWLRKTYFFLCSWQGSNLGSLDLESDALPIEPSRGWGPGAIPVERCHMPHLMKSSGCLTKLLLLSLLLLILWRTLIHEIIGAVPMVTMAQSAANWHNTHTHIDHTHSLTHLHQHSYNHVVWRASSAIIFQCMLGLFVFT